jgi:Spy/CpxP family protein refolding chaperone
MKRLANLFGARAGRYGPNSAQVERFLQLVRALTPEQWEQVYDCEAAARAAYGSPDWREIQALHEVEYGKGGWIESLDRSTRMAGWLDGRAAMVAHGAALALADCGVITAGQFTACYAPFAELIPVESLGPGKAHGVAKPPLSLHWRFVTRVTALEPHQWQQVVKTACAVQVAVGLEATYAALDAARDALGSTEFDDEVLSATCAAMDELSDAASVRQLKGLYEGFGRVAKKPAWAATRIATFESEIRDYILSAQRAVLAVGVKDAITPQQFATLYAPFAALIPFESLEAKRLW